MPNLAKEKRKHQDAEDDWKAKNQDLTQNLEDSEEKRRQFQNDAAILAKIRQKLARAQEELDDLKSREDEVEAVRGTNSTLVSENTQKGGQIAELEAEVQELDRANKADEGLQSRFNELEEEIDDLKSQVEAKADSLENAQNTNQAHKTALDRHDATAKQMTKLVHHLMALCCGDPNSRVDVGLLQPLFGQISQELDLVNALDNANAVGIEHSALVVQPSVVAQFYPETSLKTELLVKDLIAVAFGIRALTGTQLKIAVQIEQKLLLDLADNSGAAHNIVLVYRYILSQALIMAGLPFMIACRALMTLHARYPHKFPSKWDEMVQQFLQQRYGRGGPYKLSTFADPPLIDQVAIASLSTTTSIDLKKRYPDVDISSLQMSSELHVAEVALAYKIPNRVIRHMTSSGQLIAIADRSSGTYLFWQEGKDTSAWTGRFTLIASGRLLTIVSDAVVSRNGVDEPLFRIEVHDESLLAGWIRSNFPKLLQATYEQSAEGFLANLRTPSPFSIDMDVD